MDSVKASGTKRNSLFGDRFIVLSALGIAAALTFASPSAQAASAVSGNVAAAKSLKDNGTAVAVKDVEETGAVQTDASAPPNCERSRKRLFVDGEGWIVRRVTTCY